MKFYLADQRNSTLGSSDMSLSSRVKNRLVEEMHQLFDAIGSKVPKSESNSASLVWEYVVAKDLESRAKKRKEAAEDALKEAGCIPDPKAQPRGVGKHGIIFSTDFAGIMLEVRSGREVVDADLILSYLRSRNVKQELLDQARDFATSTARPAHVFSPIWLTDVSTGK